MKLLFTLVSLFSINAFCATYTVTNKLNSGNGSLRNAIIDANINPGVDTINFANNLKGTIDLANALPDINDNLFISGPGSNIITLRLFSNVGVVNDRIFNFGLGSSGKNFTLSGISLKNARGNSYDFGTSVINAGGALYLAENNNLTLIDCKFDSNKADHGGAILNVGNLTIIGSQFSNNSDLCCDAHSLTKPKALGGRIPLIITRSRIEISALNSP